MRRRLTISALLACALFAVSAVGQDPGSKKPADKTDAGKKADKGDAKKADPADAAVAAALANDPDVKVAKAKIQLAEAELVKAKQAVVVKVMALTASIRELQSTVEQNRERADWADRMVKQGYMTQAQAQAERSRLESSQLALAKAETELKFLTGGGGDPDSAVKSGLWWLSRHADDARRRELEFLYAQSVLAAHAAWLKAPAGAIPDRIRAALDKPVKLAPKGEKVPFDKALEVFKKEAGFDVPIRPGLPVPLPDVVSQGEEMPLGAWLQLYQDTSPNPFTFYVREYGLLVANKNTAPPDAPTLTEFWKQKPPAAKPETAPEPKPGK